MTGRNCVIIGWRYRQYSTAQKYKNMSLQKGPKVIFDNLQICDIVLWKCCSWKLTPILDKLLSGQFCFSYSLTMGPIVMGYLIFTPFFPAFLLTNCLRGTVARSQNGGTRNLSQIRCWWIFFLKLLQKTTHWKFCLIQHKFVTDPPQLSVSTSAPLFRANTIQGAVHFSTKNLQCNNFLSSSLNGISFHGINHLLVDNR